MNQHEIDSLWIYFVWHGAHLIMYSVLYRWIFKEQIWVGFINLITKKKGGMYRYETATVDSNPGPGCCDSEDCDGDHEIGAQRIYHGEW
jgi:hypothetical protein